MGNEVLLSAKNIFKQYNRLQVLDDISLTLKKGEIICVLGASGCGKTTLLKILAGLETQSKGQVKSDIQLPGPSVGYMSQEESLLPWKTALQNVAFSLDLLGISDNKKALKMLQSVHLSRFHHYYPAQLSGGQKQRINLARMLVLEPKILFLDEPLSALDILVKNDLAKIIKEYVQNSGAAAFMITHSIEEALLLADKIIILTTLPARIYREINIKESQREDLYAKVKGLFEEAVQENSHA